MSGFLAMVRTDGARLDGTVLARAAEPLRRRGPHGEALWYEGAVGCVFRRFTSHDGEEHQSVATLADGGRLVGHIRLDDQRTLRAASPRARDAADDASLLAALLDQRGDSARHELLGDYSVATVHPGDAPIALRAWRDSLAVRLLYYARTAEYVAVSNTIEALLRVPGVSDRLDDDVVADFLDVGGRVDRAQTFFADVRRLLPGQLLTVARDGTSTLSGRWTVPDVAQLRFRDPREYPERFRAILDEAVSDRLRAPRASVIMSGGLDSTALAAVAARVHPGGTLAIRGVTATYRRVVRSDESEFARLAMAHAGLPLMEVEADNFGYLEQWERVIARPTPAGEPDFALWNALHEGASAFGPAALSGFDGDSLLEPPSIRPLLRVYSPVRLLFDSLRYRVAHRRRPYLSLRGLWARPFVPPEPWPWIRRRLGPPLADPSQPHPTRPEMIASLRGAQWEHIFESSDQGFTGIPVDVRFPFLDRRLIEFVLAIPPIPWVQRKLILREAMRGLLPEAVRTRPKRVFDGYYEGRLAQLQTRKGGGGEFRVVPHPVPALERYVDLRTIPSALPYEDRERALALLRVRELNDWLRARSTPNRF
jgi:asparagine synthase (glutamine-hydrolysing)